MQHIGIKLALLIFLSFPFANGKADHIPTNITGGLGYAGGGINSESGVTLGKGNVAIGFRMDFQKFEKRSDAKFEELGAADPSADLHTTESILSPSLNAAIGVTDDLSVGFTVPWIFRENVTDIHDGDTVVQLGDVEGIGDTTVFGQYRFFHSEQTDSYASSMLGATQTHVSTIFGVKAPTGRKNKKSDTFFADGEFKKERFEAELQPGSGSWDFLLGLAATQMYGPITWSTSAVYNFVNEGSQHTDLGDIISYNTALAYRLDGDLFASSLIGSSLGLFDNVNVDLILELNGEFRDKEQTNGSDDDNSGGNLLFIAPGLRMSGGGLSAAVSGGFPISTDLNGDQVEPDFRVTGVISFVF